MPRTRFEALLRRRTKIVATIGPATATEAAIGRLLDAGAEVARLNFSHGDHESHARAFAAIRAAAAARRVPVAVLADLCGPKLRVRVEGASIELVEGAPMVVTTRASATPVSDTVIVSDHEELPHDVTPGSAILLSDGLLELRVERVEGADVHCTVARGGTLSDRAGMNLPGANVSAPALTEKDCDDVAFGLELGVDLFALSFVRSADDVQALRAQLPEGGPRIIAKIERAEAVEAIGPILDAADGLMVARGDLGVELGPEMVPVVQAELVSAARAAGKPVIVATQMLESMREHRVPTRAEVSDVSTAVMSGADAVMLSAETASGRYPTESVAMMDRIARRIEGHLWAEDGFRFANDTSVVGGSPLYSAMARAIAQLSREVRLHAIVAFTNSGATAATIASARPAAPLIAACAVPGTLRQMNLLWGVLPVETPDVGADQLPALARSLSVERDLAVEGDHVLAVSGFAAPGTPATPTLTVIQV